MKRAPVWWLLLASCATWSSGPQTNDEWNAAYRACRDGNQTACYWKIGSLAPGERRAAYQRACEANVAAACNDLGFFVAQDGQKTRAVELWRKSCELGSKDGCDSYGTGLRDGLGGAVDETGAVAAYELACRQNDAAGCTNLGRQLLNGRGVARDTARAEKLWRTTCASEEIHDSCRVLGLALVRGEGLTKDVDGGVVMLKRACRYGKAADCFAASEVLEELQQPAEALRYLRTSCAWGSSNGCRALAKVLRTGKPGDEEEREALEAEAFVCSHGDCDGGAPEPDDE